MSMQRGQSTRLRDSRMRSALVASLLAIVPSCDRTPERSSKSFEVTARQILPPSTVPVRDSAPTPCPHTGLWAECNVERRLRQSGFVVKRLDESPKRPGFSIAPVVYKVGSARLEVFFYRDANTLAEDIAKLDTLTVAPPGVPGVWEIKPVLVRSANIAAVFLTQSPVQAERLTLALTAGAPQPGSPR